MARPGTARAADLVMLLVAAASLLALAGAVRALPPVSLAEAPLTWTAAAPLLGIIAVATVAAGVRFVAGLRHGSLAALIEAGAAAALAGGGTSALVGGAPLAPALVASAALIGASRVARRAGTTLDRVRAVGVSIGLLVVAEGTAVVALLAGLDDLRLALLATTIALGVLAAVASPRDAALPVFLGVAAAALLADRGRTLEAGVGMVALLAGLLVTLHAWLISEEEDTGEQSEALPELASRLADAVLRFDGRLQLRDFNASAASLLGLDAASIGTRLEDLLGVSLADLPGPDGSAVSRRALGGLEVSMHRYGLGVTAVIRDPGATPEAERLGIELRSTIEELLRARRTIDLQRGELERASTVDPLTGISSRGAILERLRLEVAQARRYRHPLAVVLLDLDAFGELNRRHGIAGGDAALREVALRIRLRVREADALGRSGSDGFLAVLPHTDETGAATFADALRHRLSLRPVAIGEAFVAVTASIGVATMRAGEDLDVDGLLARVQEALDSARTAGGDRIALDRLHGLARLEDPHDRPGGTADEARAAEDV